MWGSAQIIGWVVSILTGPAGTWEKSWGMVTEENELKFPFPSSPHIHLKLSTKVLKHLTLP